MIDLAGLGADLQAHLVRQSWFTEEPETAVSVGPVEVLRRGWPALVRAEVVAGVARYQLLLGLRPSGAPPDWLEGRPEAVVGEVESPAGRAIAYDAVVDSELCLVLLRLVAPTLPTCELVRPVGTQRTSTSLVYDETVVLKLFRRLCEGPNPDAEISRGLMAVGFHAVPELLAEWHLGGRDLAIVRRYLPAAVEGWALAATSLRDLYASPVDPAMAGGDFAAESKRLGETTGQLHTAMATAFGRHEWDAGQWASEVRDKVRSDGQGAIDLGGARPMLEGVEGLADVGPSIRVHGDYTLREVLRSDAGWSVIDFGGEARAAHPSSAISALRDVATMLRSLHYAAVLTAGPEDDAAVLEAGLAWERRNRRAFLDGYRPSAQSAGLWPADDAAFDALLAGFELERALEELAYERRYRPDVAAVPLAALRRIAQSANGFGG